MITKGDLRNQRDMIQRELDNILMGMDEQVPGIMKRVRSVVKTRFKILLDRTPSYGKKKKPAYPSMPDPAQN